MTWRVRSINYIDKDSQTAAADDFADQTEKQHKSIVIAIHTVVFFKLNTCCQVSWIRGLSICQVFCLKHVLLHKTTCIRSLQKYTLNIANCACCKLPSRIGPWNTTSGSLKVLEYQYQKTVGTLCNSRYDIWYDRVVSAFWQMLCVFLFRNMILHTINCQMHVFFCRYSCNTYPHSLLLNWWTVRKSVCSNVHWVIELSGKTATLFTLGITLLLPTKNGLWSPHLFELWAAARRWCSAFVVWLPMAFRPTFDSFSVLKHDFPDQWKFPFSSSPWPVGTLAITCPHILSGSGIVRGDSEAPFETLTSWNMVGQQRANADTVYKHYVHWTQFSIYYSHHRSKDGQSMQQHFTSCLRK